MKKIILAVNFVCLTATAGTWNYANDPANFDDNYVYTLRDLPKKATLPSNKIPWASSYWPRYKGSINYRWNTENPTGFNIINPTRAEAHSMSLGQLARLSPAEKFDLAHGNYDFPLSTSVAAGASPSAKDYEGICDGWTAGSIQFPEPKPVNFTNPHGLVVPFGSADLKALISYDISINQDSRDLGTTFVGQYCKRFGFNAAACDDINPGAMHVILANQLGLKKEAFAADIDPGHETWNQPVYAFESEIRGMGVGEVVVHTKLYYTEDDPEGAQARDVFSWEPTNGTSKYTYGVMELDYTLELDSAGRIIGGSWMNGVRHPDLFWLPMNKIKLTSEFALLYKILGQN